MPQNSTLFIAFLASTHFIAFLAFTHFIAFLASTLFIAFLAYTGFTAFFASTLFIAFLAYTHFIAFLASTHFIAFLAYTLFIAFLTSISIEQGMGPARQGKKLLSRGAHSVWYQGNARHNRYDKRVLETWSRCKASKHCYFYFCKQITRISLVKMTLPHAVTPQNFLRFCLSSILHNDLWQWFSTKS